LTGLLRRRLSTATVKLSLKGNLSVLLNRTSIMGLGWPEGEGNGADWRKGEQGRKEQKPRRGEDTFDEIPKYTNAI